jgi:hypothetical protein
MRRILNVNTSSLHYLANQGPSVRLSTFGERLDASWLFSRSALLRAGCLVVHRPMVSGLFLNGRFVFGIAELRRPSQAKVYRWNQVPTATHLGRSTFFSGVVRTLSICGARNGSEVSAE